jgi:hypothetical protein
MPSPAVAAEFRLGGDNSGNHSHVRVGVAFPIGESEAPSRQFSLEERLNQANMGGKRQSKYFWIGVTTLAVAGIVIAAIALTDDGDSSGGSSKTTNGTGTDTTNGTGTDGTVTDGTGTTTDGTGTTTDGTGTTTDGTGTDTTGTDTTGTDTTGTTGTNTSGTGTTQTTSTGNDTRTWTGGTV